MHVVYEPKGRAREYSDLACNLYIGCSHACRYCFAPGCMRKTAEEWHSSIKPRLDVISLFARDAEKLRGDKRKILFSFLSDPYQPLEKKYRLTRQALGIVVQKHLRSQILTKGCANLIREDLPLIKRAGTELGITLSFSDDDTRKQWEPAASTVEDRLKILKEAHAEKIYTWVSLEPVIDAKQALEVIRMASPYVNFWKVGKLNHMKDVEARTDWKIFARDVEKLLKSLKAQYYIKQDLVKYI